MGIYRRWGSTLVIPRVSPYQFRRSDAVVLTAIRPGIRFGFFIVWSRYRKLVQETPRCVLNNNFLLYVMYSSMCKQHGRI
jgi:hypothetical protein